MKEGTIVKNRIRVRVRIMVKVRILSRVGNWSQNFGGNFLPPKYFEGIGFVDPNKSLRQKSTNSQQVWEIPVRDFKTSRIANKSAGITHSTSCCKHLS